MRMQHSKWAASTLFFFYLIHVIQCKLLNGVQAYFSGDIARLTQSMCTGLPLCIRQCHCNFWISHKHKKMNYKGIKGVTQIQSIVLCMWVN